MKQVLKSFNNLNYFPLKVNGPTWLSKNLFLSL